MRYFLKIILAMLVLGIANQATATEPKIDSVVFAFSKDSSDLHIKNLNKAEELYNKRKYEDALKLYLDFIKNSEKNKNYEGQIIAYFNSAKILKDFQRYEKALEYGNIALELSKKSMDTLFLIKASQLLGETHFNLYKSNNKLFEKHVDSLYHYNNKIPINILNQKKFKTYSAIKHNSFGIAFLYQKKYRAAIQEVQKSLLIHRELKDTIGQVISLNTLASNYIQLKDIEMAKKKYLQAIALLEQTNSNRKASLGKIIYNNLAWTFYKTEDHKAYEYLVKAEKIADSIRNHEFEAQIAEIEAKHNVDIIKQNAAKKQLIETQKKNRLQYLAIGLSICILIMVLLFLQYSNNIKLKQANKDLQLAQSELIKEKEIERLQEKARSNVINATIDGKEAERKQIAETLHDSVSALLSAASLHLRASKTKVKKENSLEIDKTLDILEDASSQIRNLSHELISSILLKFGLAYAIHDICEKASNSNLTISSSTENLQRYDVDFEIKINNIIKEFINNLIKHSQATVGSVSMVEYGKKLYIEVEDNGIGFDSNNIPVKGGVGLHQIKARIHKLKGKINIDSQPGQGTSIEITVPILYKSNN